MIDDPTAVARLVDRLRAHPPVPAVPSRELVRTLRQQGLRARPGHPLPLQIDDVSARRRWRGRRDRSVDRLLHYARVDRVERVLRSDLKALH